MVEPHEEVCASFEYPAEVARHTWAEFDDELREDLGFLEGACEPHETFNKVVEAPLTPGNMDAEHGATLAAPPA